MTVSLEVLLKDSQFQSAAKNVQNAMLKTSVASAKMDNALEVVKAKSAAAGNAIQQKQVAALALLDTKSKIAANDTKKLTDALTILEKKSEHASAAMAQKHAFALDLIKEKSASATAGTNELADSMGAAGPEGMALGTALKAVGAAAAIVIGVVSTLIVETVKLAIEQVGLREKLLTTFSALAGGEAAGKATLAMFDSLSSKLPQSREQLAEWTKSYQAMGITDISQLKNQVTATASAAALMGDEGASAFDALSKKIQTAAQTGQGLKVPLKGLASLATMGLQVDDVAKKMGVSAKVLAGQLKAGTTDATKFGAALQSALIDKGAGPLAQMGGELSTQWSKFKENIGQLFSGVDVAPFLGELKKMFSIFDQATPTGKIMKSQITGAMNSIFAVLTKLVPYVKLFFLYIVKYALEAKIFLVPLVAKIKEFWQQHDGMTKLMVVLKGVGIVLGVIGAAVLVAVGSFLAFVAVSSAVTVAVFGVIGAIVALVVAGVQIFNSWVASAIDVGSRFIDGLVNGISQGAARVKQAAMDVAMAAKNAVTDALGIHSPSRVMMQLGGHMATGLAQGLSGGGGEVAAAAGSVSGGAVSAMASGGSAPAPSGGGMTINVGGITIGGGGGEGASKTALELTEEAVIQLFERVALAQGVGST